MNLYSADMATRRTRITRRPRPTRGGGSIGTVPVHLFEGLTERQVHALVSTIEGRFFELPARQKMDRIAAQEGLSRSTFAEHLRKAETQILQNPYPLLKLRDQMEKADGSSCRAADG